LLILLGTLTTWWLANNKIIDPALQQKWIYFVVGELFLSTFFTFAEYLGFDFTLGRHIPDLLRPQNYIKMELFNSYGEASVQNLIKTTILLIIFLVFIGLKIIDFNLQAFLLMFLCWPFALLILYLSGLIVGCSGFFLPRVHGVVMNYTFLLGLLMGRIFPLNLLIPNFWFNLGNPFAYLFYHPMQIYLGKYTNLEIFYVFLGGIFWCIILYFLAKLVFKMGLKKNESVGL
jgi:ABC-2 type transport system permease protein